MSPSSSSPSSSPRIRIRAARREDIPIVAPMMLEAFRGRPMNEALFPAHLRGDNNNNNSDDEQIVFRIEGMMKRLDDAAAAAAAAAAEAAAGEGARDEVLSGQDRSNGTGNSSISATPVITSRRHILVAVEERDMDGHVGDDDEEQQHGTEEVIVGYAEWTDHQVQGRERAQDTKAPPTTTTKEEKEEEAGARGSWAEQAWADTKAREARFLAERMATAPPGLDQAAVAVIKSKAAELEEFLKEALGVEGCAHAWSLDAIGVDPRHQRKGVGRLLMQYGAERADRDGKNIHFLASEAGSKMYRALGYEDVGSLDVLGGTEYAFVRRASK